MGTGDGPPVIEGWQLNGQLAFASTIAQPERASADVRRLLATLQQRQAEIQATARRVFGIPALLAKVDDQRLLAKRRRLVGTPGLRADRSTRRMVQGDGRAAVMTAGAA